MKNQDEAELCFPQLLNMSCRKPKYRLSHTVFLYLMSFISVPTVILNLLVIISVSHFRQLHTPTNLLLLSLAVSDFLFGLVVTPLVAQRQTGCWLFGDIVCSVINYVGAFCFSISIGGMVLISVDRYVAICDPLHYPTRVTVRRVKICVYVSWFFAVLYNCVFYREMLTEPGKYNYCYGECVVVIDNMSKGFDIIMFFLFPVIVIVVLYMRVFLTAVSQARAMRSHVAATTLHHSGTVLTKKSELKAARTLGIVILVFLICFCPAFSMYYAPNIYVNTYIIDFMMYLNPCLNPVIYALFYPWFRKSVRLIISLQILQPGSSETNML